MPPLDPNQTQTPGDPGSADPLAALNGDMAPAQPVDPNAPPAPGETTRQQVYYVQGAGGAIGGLGGPLGVVGGPTMMGCGSPYLSAMGNPSNPCGFWGWGNGYLGSYAVYRWMLNHPTLRLARQIVVGPVVASGFYYEGADNAVPQPVIEFVTKQLDRIRPSFIQEAVRCIDFGWSGFEVCWKIGERFYEIDKLKPLLIDRTLIRVDPQGNFTGFLNDGVFLKSAEHKALIVTHDGEAGNLYGRSRLENVRETAWMSWLNASQKLEALTGKITGRQGYAIVPPGGYINPADGKFRSYAQDAADALTGFSQGKNPILTSIAMSAADPQIQAKLATAALTTFATIDFGNEAPAIAGLLEQLRYSDENMFKGYLRPSRSGLEGQHGTLAEAEAHTDTGITDSQLLGDSIAGQVQALADELVMVNFNLPAGTVRVRQSPLADDRKARFSQLIQSMNFSPQFQQAMESTVDFDKVLDALDIPRTGPIDAALQQVLQAAMAMAQQQAQMQPEQQGTNGKAKNGTNRNGRLSGTAA